MENPVKQINESSSDRWEVYLKARETLTWESDQEKLATKSGQAFPGGGKACLHTGDISVSTMQGKGKRQLYKHCMAHKHF